MKIRYIFFLLLVLFSLESQERELAIKVGILDPQIYGGLQSFETSSSEDGLEKMALKRILEIQGIPFDFIEANQNLSDYRLIITVGPLENPNITQDLMNHLLDYMERGGTVFSAGAVGSKLFSLYGIEQHSPSLRRYRLHFQGHDPSFYYMDQPQEKTISLGNGEAHFYDDVIWSHGYTIKDNATILGRFEDDLAGFLVNSYGRGKAYLLGMTFVESVLLPQRGGDFEAQRKFVNSFEPSADVIMLLIKALYQDLYSTSVVLSVIPEARPNALLLTHDVDAQTAFLGSLEFEKLESKYNTTGTYFITTKNFINADDINYYSVKENLEALRLLYQKGADIASHSLSHYKYFSLSPLGDPNSNLDNYDPTREITVYGEVNVSKYLLDRDLPGLNTISFRSGYLEFPYQLIEALEHSGYLYDSSFSANDTLTAFPSIALEQQHLGSKESGVVEIPVTMDDALDFLIPSTVDQAIEQWKYLSEANGNNGGINVLLIHPSDSLIDDYKIRAQEGLMKFISEQDGWMGNLTEFGDYWVQRQNTSYKVYSDPSRRLIIELNQPTQDIHPWISFELKGIVPDEIILRDNNKKELEYNLEHRAGRSYISLKN